MDYREAATVLKDSVGLATEPVAVKFHEAKPLPEGFVMVSERRYCQALMGARQGKRLALTAENISCPAAAWAFGFREPPLPLARGTIPAATGIFGSDQAARTTLGTMSRLEMGKYQMLTVSPLGETPFDPDVIVVESVVEHLMWIALALVRETGGRLQFSTAILQATCVDATTIPFLTQKMNASLACYGCREATDLREGEAVLGFPLKDLETIVGSLRALHEKAIPRVRLAAPYRALMSRNEPC